MIIIYRLSKKSYSYYYLSYSFKFLFYSRTKAAHEFFFFNIFFLSFLGCLEKTAFKSSGRHLYMVNQLMYRFINNILSGQ